MTRALDLLDQQILSELRRNARRPLAALGERVLLSRNAVRQRIERLERDGFIQGYTIVEHNPRAVPVVSAHLLVYRADRMRGADVLAALRAIPEVVLCDVLSGEFDLFVRLEARTVDRVQAIWQQIARHPGVKDITTGLTLSTEIRRIFPLGHDRDSETG
jgi:Lrp/AsnC family transcriptional regulator, leucine-responsive regulatory protein